MNAPRVKLIIGLIFREVSAAEKARLALTKLFGNIDFESAPLAFNHTDYYRKEFGSGLKRRFFSFRRLIPAQHLARIKVFTNNLEQKLSRKSTHSTRPGLKPGVCSGLILSGIPLPRPKVRGLNAAEVSRRLVNIDPGYLDLAKLVLASTKDYRHRIYLERGIYVEITLFYQRKTFNPWEWTYPDYRSREYIEVFNRIREIYKKQLQECAPHTSNLTKTAG
ncbi:MAG: hypothetical protein A3G38_03040 [Omnitrophica WOR_2 bacterium RIFCSPLOWO2_12_FULL_51_8]|nr:MAG: hypothetical protein A3G38_03040 [Omnitrophica WOR_2 bacterium RIFCSPLOWO2_12_FULL_51_8]